MNNLRQVKRDHRNVAFIVLALVVPALLGLWWIYGIYAFVLITASIFS